MTPIGRDVCYIGSFKAKNIKPPPLSNKKTALVRGGFGNILFFL
jgi:hypothetical protein